MSLFGHESMVEAGVTGWLVAVRRRSISHRVWAGGQGTRKGALFIGHIHYSIIINYYLYSQKSAIFSLFQGFRQKYSRLSLTRVEICVGIV